MTPVRIAVIGAGMIGRAHIDILRRDPQCAVAGIADPSAAAAAYAAELSVPCFAEPGAMLDATKPDGAIVATPNALHLAHTKACAERGVHVLVEKPIADTLEAAHELTAAARRAGIAVLIGHHRRHNPIIEKAREIVRAGRIGRLTAVAALWLLRKSDDYYEATWRRQPGAGPILNNLIHDIDDLRYICGEIDSVQAIVSNNVRSFAVEDTAVVALHFADGALGTVTLSDAVAAPWSWELTSGENPVYPQQPENCYLITGTEGSLTVPKLELWRYDREPGWHAPLSREAIEVVRADPLVRQIQHFCRIVRDGEAPRVTGEDSTRTLATVLAVASAAGSSRAVAVGTLADATTVH